MFKKCLKYDLASVFKLWCIVAVVFVTMSVPIGLALRYAALAEYDDVFATLVGVFASGIAYAAVVAFPVVTAIAVYVRYYKSFFSDEGYLTFTLPVKRKTLFYSKLLSAVIWELATVAVILIATLVVLAIMPPLDDVMIAYPDLDITVDIGSWGILWAIEIAAFVLLLSVAGTLLVYFCITLGSIIAKKQKVLLSVGLWYLVNQVALPIISFVLILVVSVMVMSAASAFPELVLGSAEANGALSILILIVDLAVAAVCACLAFVNLDLIERKLNLA